MTRTLKYVPIAAAAIALVSCKGVKKSENPSNDAAAVTKTTTETRTEEVETLTEAGEKQIVKASKDALEQVRAARKAIAAKDKPAALKATLAAGIELTKARDLVPEIRVRDQIWSARNQLIFEVDEVIPKDLVLIEEEIDRSDDYTVTDKEGAKKRTAKAKEHAKTKKSKEAKEELELLDSLIIRRSVFLPILPASQHLYAAVARFVFSDLAAVDTELKAVEDNLVVIEDDVIDLPITQVSRHLSEAKKSHKAKDKAKRDKHLDAAWTLLSKLESEEGEVADFIAKEAKAVSALIESVKKEEDQAKADAMMERLERRGFGLIGSWMQLMALDASKKLERVLVEAHGQTEFAAFELMVMKDRAGATSEIDKAISTLGRAKTMASDKMAPTVDAMLAAAGEVKAALTKGEADVAARRLAALNAKLFESINTIEATKRERKK